MQISSDDRLKVSTVANSIGVPIAALLAVMEVESNGNPGTIINGKLEPTIRYEGHYFDKLCNPGIRDAARKAGVSSPKAGSVKNPSHQVDVWALVKKAATFDREAAYESCSYGVGQVMGAHYKALGYPSIDAFLAKAREGLGGQVEIMGAFIRTNGLSKHLINLDWSSFARAYNGPDYLSNKYDTKLADAYARWGGTSSIGVAEASFLRLGSKGANVRDLQALLSTAGYTIKIDGDFGPTTESAVKAFQSKNGCEPDGKVGPETQKALMGVRAVSPENPGSKSFTQLPVVQAAAAIAVTAPAALGKAKDGLQAVADQVAPYSELANVNNYIHTGLMFLTIGSIIAAAVVALWAWYKHNHTHVGTKATDTPILPLQVANEDLVATGTTSQVDPVLEAAKLPTQQSLFDPKV